MPAPSRVCLAFVRSERGVVVHVCNAVAVNIAITGAIARITKAFGIRVLRVGIGGERAVVIAVDHAIRVDI